MTTNLILIDLASFRPVHCDEALRNALGYRTDKEIQDDFLQSSHLQNMSLLQLYQTGLQSCDEPVRLLSRQGKFAGTVKRTSVNNARTQLKLEVETSIRHHNAVSEKLLLTLLMDEKKIITSVSGDDVEQSKFLGREFSRAISPIGWSARISRIYGYCLNKKEVTSLRHLTVFPDGHLLEGRWQVERMPPESPHTYKASFFSEGYSPDPATFRMQFYRKYQRTDVAFDSRLLTLAPIAPDIMPPDLEDYLATVLPEDRLWVRQVLLHDGLPRQHELTYRVAGQDGVVRTLRHRLSRIARGRNGSQVDSTLQLVPAEEVADVCLATISTVFDLDVHQSTAADRVWLPQFHRLALFLTRLKALLRADGYRDRITISKQAAETCSLCDVRAKQQACLSLELSSLKLNRQQLRKLMTSDKSQFGISKTSSWKSWFSELHASGFHLSIGLGDREQVTIGIFGND